MLDIVINIAVVVFAPLATFFIAHKNRAGFYCFFVVEVCYVYIGVTTAQYGMIGVAILYFFMNIYGLYKWTKDLEE